MDRVLQETAEFVRCPSGIGSMLGLLRCGYTRDGRRWAAKTPEWPPGCRGFPIRLGVEFLFHALASHNRLPMPTARILQVGDDLCWAMEIVSGRDALGKRDQALADDLVDEVRKSLLDSQEEREYFLRAAFLDVMLLGADRTPTNILVHRAEKRLRMFYIDHEQSFGWRNNPNEPEKNKILPPEEEYARIDSYTGLGRMQSWANQVSYPRNRRDIFKALELDTVLLDDAMSKIPAGWVSAQQFSEMRSSLAAWWDLVRKKPYEEIDQQIFG